jgi:hypothetical protein
MAGLISSVLSLISRFVCSEKSVNSIEVARAGWTNERPFNRHSWNRIPAREPAKLDQQLPAAFSHCHHPAMLPSSPVYMDETLAPTVPP